MIEFFQLAFVLALGHFVADYPLQSDFIAKGKNPFREIDPSTIPPGQKPQLVWPWVLTAHAATHAAAVYLITGSHFLAAVELVAHWAIDYGKCANRYGIHVDQGLHMACKLLWAVMLVAGLA